MKSGIVVKFGADEILGMLLDKGRGEFSLSRFKRAFKKKVGALLAAHYRDSLSPGIELSFGRLVIRDLDEYVHGNFLLDVACISGGVVRCRQTFEYRFNEPGQSLSGVLVPKRRRYAK